MTVMREQSCHCNDESTRAAGVRLRLFPEEPVDMSDTQQTIAMNAYNIGLKIKLRSYPPF